MTERKLYTCDICHTDYRAQSMALECEKSHKQPLDIAGARYVAMNNDSTGYPVTITVRFTDGSTKTYK